ncbi:MAG: translocation/assembly module TamB domain-containing protein [Armatimonadota bacterium]
MSRRLSFLALLIAVAVVVGALAWTVVALSQRARDMAIAAVSAALGREITARGMSGNPWSGLVLEGVIVWGAPPPPPAPGTPAARPPAILKVRRMIVHLNPFTLTRDLWVGQGAAASLSQIVLEEPVLVAARDVAGVWNIGGLTPYVSGAKVAGAFTGRMLIVNGTVTLSDRHRIAPKAFEARFEDINIAADFGAVPRVTMRASLVEERENRRIPARVLATYTETTGTIDVDLTVTGADAGAWGPYLAITPLLQITGGQFDAAMNVLRTGRPGREATDYQGKVVIRDGSAVVPARGTVLAGVHGTIVVSNQSLSTGALRGRVNGSPVEVRGEASFYDNTRMDLAMRSSGIDLATLRRLVFPSARVRIGGVASGDARIVGFLETTPRIDGRIAGFRGVIDSHAFDGASGSFALYGQTLSVAGTGRTAGGDVSANAWWSLASPSFLVDMQVSGVSASSLARMSGSIPEAVREVDGRLTGSFTARGRGADVAVSGQGSLTKTRLDGIALDSLDAAFTSDASGVVLHQARAQQGRSVAHLRGQISPRGALALAGHAESIDLAGLAAIPRDLGLGGRLDATGHVRGTLAAPVFAGNVQVAKARLGGLAFDTARGELELRPGRLDLDSFVARSRRSRYWATGAFRWDPAAHLAITLETERGSAATLAAVAGIPFTVTGSVEGRVHLEGPPARPSVAGSVSLQDATIQGQTVDEATASFRSDGMRLTVEQALLKRRASVVELSGTIDRRTGLDLGVAAKRFDLRDLTLPPIGAIRTDGHVDLSGRISGPTSAPRIAATATSTDLSINGIKLDHATGSVRWEARTLHLDPLALQLRNERYEITGNISLAGPPQASLAAKVDDGRLSTLLGLADIRLGMPLDGTISGLATLEGPLANPAARLDLRLRDGRFGDHRLQEGHADLTLREGSVTIEEFQVRPLRGLIGAQGRLNLRGESQIEVSGSDLDLDILRPLFRLRRPLLGRLNFTTQLTGTLGSPEIGFATDIRGGGIEGATFDSLVANAFYRDGLLQLQQALLVQNGHKLRASGSVPFNPALRSFDESRPIDLRLTLADVNLGLLRLATDRIDEAVGAVEGEVHIGGTARAPRVEGRVQVQDGRIRVKGLQTPIEALRLDLRFDEAAIRVAEATARLGGGVARLEGALRLASFPRPGSAPTLGLLVPEDAPLVLTGSDLRLAAPPYIEARAAGTLRAWGTLGDPRRPPTLEGTIAVSDGTVSVAADVGGTPSELPLVFRGIRFEIGPNLAVRVGGLQFALQPGGSVLLTGSPRAPALEGTLAAQPGKISALGTLFDLREGTATFLPPQGVRPRIFAQAETLVGATRILLTVRGVAPDGLVLDLTSEPDLPRREILALLGQQAGLSRLLAGDVEGALRAQIGRLLFGQVSLGVGRAIGLDELVIEYDFQRPLALRAGRLLLNDLYWTVSTSFAAQPLWVTGLEYRFARNWTLSLRLDSEGRREAVMFYSARF